MSRTGEHFETAIDNMIAKRTADSMSVLTDCLEAGIRNGKLTANDIRDKGFAEPNVIGGTMRACLPGCGFVVDRTRMIQTKAEKKHSRWIPTWILEEPGKAQAVLDRMKKLQFDLIGTPEAGGTTQGNLFMGMNQ